MRASNEMRELDPEELVRFGKAWRGLGDAVAEQVEAVVREGPAAAANPNAIELAQQRLRGFNQQLDEDLQEWLDADAAREEDVDG